MALNGKVTPLGGDKYKPSNWGVIRMENISVG